MKSYTDIEQSRKLAEILPIESADMCFNISQRTNMPPLMTPYCKFKEFFNMEETPDFLIPCWSLAALLSVIPQEIFDGEYVINITEGCDDKWVLTYDLYENRHHSYYGLSSGADNCLDACVEMIAKLHEQKLL